MSNFAERFRRAQDQRAAGGGSANTREAVSLEERIATYRGTSAEDEARAQAREAAREWSRSEEGQEIINRGARENRAFGERYFGTTILQARTRERQRLENIFTENRTERILRRRAEGATTTALAAAEETTRQQNESYENSRRTPAVTREGTSSADEAPPAAPPAYANVDFEAASFINEVNFRSQRSGGAGESFSIQEFRENVVNSVLPTHSFLVVFSPMNWVNTNAARDGILRDLTMRCENVVLPTLGLLQQDNLRRYGYGPIENVPYGYNMGDFTLQFLVDKDAKIVNFFESWTNFIVNRDSYGGATMDFSPGALMAPYELAFKDDYVCPSVNVFVYDRSQNRIFEYNIYDAYPNSIQSMNLSWSDENQLMRLNVGFAFTDMRLRTSYDPNSRPLDLNVLLNKNISDLGISAIDPTVNVPTLNLGIADTINQPISVGDDNTPLVTQPAVIESFTQPSLAVELPYDEVTIASPQNFE